MPSGISDTLTQWLTAINAHDTAGLSALMDTNFVFVDSLSNRISGAESMEAGWRGYFAMCPDFWVRADHTMAEGDTMLIAGEAGGTINGESWRTPSAWLAVFRDGRLAEWRVFADNKPVYEILARRQP